MRILHVALVLALAVGVAGCASSETMVRVRTDHIHHRETIFPGANPELVIDALFGFEGSITAGGQLVGIHEDGGSCAFTLQNALGDKKILTTTGEKHFDNRTFCGPVITGDLVLRPGKWLVTLNYESATAGKFESEPVLIEVKPPGW